MKLSKVLKNVAFIKKNEDCLVKGLAYDSRNMKKDFLFVAIKGYKQDGHRYIEDAKKNGACAAIVESPDSSSGLLQIKVDNSRVSLSKVAQNFYKNPTADLTLIGVTGTNGKTTTSFMLESIWKAAGNKTALLGTVQNHIGGKSFPVSHTTPESVDLQRFFYKTKEERVQTAIMEVSSHASLLHRTDNCLFDQLIFTNLTQDHLDFHKDLENYFAAKKKLFDLNKDIPHIINYDDKFGRRLINSNQKVITYGMEEGADFRASDIELTKLGSYFKVNYLGHEFKFEIMVGGYFNIYNALATIASSISLDLTPEIIQSGFFNLESIPGRFEVILSKKSYKVIIDYAHTPDGLKNLLDSVRKVTEGRMITVFGCGGERDKGKRPKMGKIASDLSDKVIITSDNPRREEPSEIINQITAGDGNYFQVEVDRKKAISDALAMAKSEDTVVIAGKGHEMTQEIDGIFLPFNDSRIVKELIH